MNPNYKCLLRHLILYAAIFCLTACAKLPVQPPIDMDQGQKDLPESVKEKIAADQSTISLIKILSAEAKKFSLQGNYQDALFIYNQALTQAEDADRSDILSDIELLLAKTPAKDIQEFSDIKNIKIPRSLLLYWLGLNYALEDNPVKSKQTLETFLFQYPDHPYSSDAADLLDVIKKSLFNRHTIGCLLPLTGKYAVFGQRALTGIQLAVQELSKKYSRQFNIIIKDTQADPDLAVKGVRELHEKKCCRYHRPTVDGHSGWTGSAKTSNTHDCPDTEKRFSVAGGLSFCKFHHS
jgi:branched-chain amino acid transport system substrate-binding protein